MLFLLAALAAAGVLVALYFAHGFLAGWTSTMVLILLSTSVVLLSIGVIGIYLASMFEQVRQRPHYLTQEALNFPED
jgi:dolichol-phosphate mannosyltransferase